MLLAAISATEQTVVRGAWHVALLRACAGALGVVTKSPPARMQRVTKAPCSPANSTPSSVAAACSAARAPPASPTWEKEDRPRRKAWSD